MEFALPGIKIIVTEDYEQMSAKAACIMAAEINAKPDIVLGLATGGTPEGLYRELVRKNKVGEVSFAGVTTFNLDEYYPIKKANPQSYHYFMNDNLFKHLDIDPSKVNIPSGECADPISECDAYEAKIAAAGGIDLQLVGIGMNGHVGFNEPAGNFSSKTNYTQLADSTIQANKRYFYDEKDMPRHAITMGIRTIMLARKILFLANSEKKAGIVADALLGDITPQVPASVLQLHRDVTVVLDKAAASKILGRLV